MNRCMGCMAEIPDGAQSCPQCGYVRGTAPREAYHLPPESILKGRYIVGRVLGYGGFGVTYIGYDAQLDRKVAIKEFLPSTFATRMPGNTLVTVYAGEATEQFGAGLGRFVEEAQRLAQFNGVPGIVDIYDTFAGNNTAYIVMQYLQGQDVKDILAASGPMPYEQALDIVLKICATLEPVHAQGVIHRDLSPDNIYITTDGEVKLLDFGASRYATSINSKSLSVILKSGYAPEEQYRSRGDQGPWSDVYALAATFYKMITGTTPPDSMERAIADELKEPSKLGAKLPQGGENAIMNALNVRKTDRTQSVAEFRAALTAGDVERNKVKPKKDDTGSLPPWAKRAIIGGVAALFLFAVLTVTGVIDFGQGNLLADTFGSGVPEGQVNAPGVVNQDEETAKSMVADAGLEYLIVGTEYDEKIDKGRILTQEPAPGRLIDEGGKLKVTISGGSEAEAKKQAAEGGGSGGAGVPDLTYMSADQVYATFVGLGEGYGLVQHPEYAYSDDVIEGIVLDYRVEESNGDQVIHYTLSAGPEASASGYAEPRAPIITKSPDNPSEAVLMFTYAAPQASAGNCYAYVSYSTDEGNTWLVAGTDHELSSQFSADYPDVFGNYFTDRFYEVGFVDMNRIVASGETVCYFPLGEILGCMANNAPDGEELILRVDFISDNGAFLGSTGVDQRFTLTFTGDSPHLTNTRYVFWEDLDDRVADGRVPEGSRLYERWKANKEGSGGIGGLPEMGIAADSNRVYLDETYLVKKSYEAGAYEYKCFQDGTIVFDIRGGKSKVWVYQYFDVAYSEDGSMVQTMTFPGTDSYDLPTS